MTGSRGAGWRPGPGLLPGLPTVGAVDQRAAQADVAVVEAHVLTRRDRPLRPIERHLQRVAAGADAAGLLVLAIADLGPAVERPGEIVNEPVRPARDEPAALQIRRLLADH